eukprot:TRINITY_DN20360_c0_g1_i1.p1 TRINITY_DN20360_c0_g1~~TRINITY_DN20360_c0_g1_i1.p1  ORF type:complete len:326 (+),score=49.18 TRINITY_DN20360_c0_g1_i1:39-980(+)
MNGTANAIPYHVDLPWDYAWPSYVWFYYVLLLVGFLGCILNSTTLLILLSPETGSIVESREARVLMIMLILTDFGGSFSMIVQSMGSLIQSTYIGGQAGCNAFGFLSSFMGVGTTFTLSLMAIHLYLRVTRLEKTVLPLGKIYTGIYVFVFVLSFTVGIFPGGSKLHTPGTSCSPNVMTPPFFVFMVFYAIEMSIIVVIYVKIYLYYLDITRNCSSSRLSKKKRRLLRRFTLFIVGTLVTYLPFGVYVVYIWVSSCYAPSGFTIWVIVSIYSQNIVNPFLYFYTNDMALNTLKYKLGLRESLPVKKTTTTATQ